MRFVAISKRLPGASIEALAELSVAESKSVWELYSAGAITDFHFDPAFEGGPKGIVFIDAGSRLEARDVLDKLPLVSAKLIDFDLYHLGAYLQLRDAFD